MHDGTATGSQELTWLPAWKIADLIARREVSSVDVVRHFLERIDEHDARLLAFRRLDAAGALAQAKRADDAVRRGDPLGRLHGVPIAFKELFFVEGFPVPGTYTSYLSDRSAAPPLATRDDVEVERVRAAGAVILGVTVAAVGATPGMPDPLQLPRNPWNTSHTAGGSSAGNGAVVAGGLVPLAIGDDGAGSIRIPAAFCGLVGLSPTRGRVPHVDYQSAAPRATVTVGPMTRGVRDAALALQVLAGPHGKDLVCLPDDPPDYLDALDAGITGKRFLWTETLGSPADSGPGGARTISAIQATARSLEGHGAVVEETPVAWEDPLPSWIAAQQLSGIDVAAYFEGQIPESIEEALESRERNWLRFRQVFADHDFVVSPTVQFAAPRMEEWTELCARPDALAVLSAHTKMCNVLGLPAISLPAGFEDGLPIGLQVIGRPGSERELLQVAHALLGESEQRPEE